MDPRLRGDDERGRQGRLFSDNPRQCIELTSFGHLLRVTTFGESHGPAIGCVIDGCPPGLAISEDEFAQDLQRRATGRSRHTSQRHETDALPKEYSFEPELGLRAGDDGLDLALRILRDAPLHLTEDGVLICEVGESERALSRLLPELPLAWVEFKVGQMGVFVAECRDLVTYHPRIRQLADARDAALHAAAPASASAGLF